MTQKVYCQFVYSVKNSVACFDFFINFYLFIFFLSMTMSWVSPLCKALFMGPWGNERTTSPDPCPQKIHTLIYIIYRDML